MSRESDLRQIADHLLKLAKLPESVRGNRLYRAELRDMIKTLKGLLNG